VRDLAMKKRRTFNIIIIIIIRRRRRRRRRNIFKFLEILRWQLLKFE
jgi:hypothetical protein